MFEDVLILKKGGIHIKKKNRGKFTEYCGGKVTEECIAKGKKSKDPKIRKRATFAANARKWKHENGGILKAQEGTGNNFWSKLLDAIKEGGMAARDAKLGAIGAQQVRDLYSEGKNQEAQDLAKQYAKANTTGIALAGGAASTGLIGDLMVTGTTTAADTFIDGNTKDFGKNLSINSAFDLAGHGAGKLLRNVNWNKVRNSIKSIPEYNLKTDVSEYVNIIDDVLPERQPLTTNKSKQFWDGTSKSKLTDAEKAGVPKGERNQPVKLGYRSEFPNDVVINAEHLKNEMIDLFNSAVYRDRLIKAGYSNEQIDDFLKNRMQLGAVRKAPIAISSDVELGDAAHWYRNYVKIDPNAKDINEEVFHELGHGSDFSGLYRDPRQPLITKLAFPGSNYYLDPSEIRTRGLGVLQWMKKTGKTIDDFYTPGNTDLNKRAQEFWLYYPEDQGRQYLSTFWKQGGKL